MSYSYTPYTLHGPLYVSGAKLMDGNRIPFQLHGVSTHGLAWYPQYVTKETFQYLRDAWHVNCIRLAQPDSLQRVNSVVLVTRLPST